IRVVDDVVVHERGGVNELDDGRVEDRAIAFVSRQPRRHQQHRGPDAFAAARLDVAADRRDELDARLDVPSELPIDLLEVGANGLEDLRQRRRGVFHGAFRVGLYHGRKSVWKLADVRAAMSAGVTSCSSASVSTTRATYAGSLRFPRYGTGARNRLSVSASSRSSGTRRTVSRRLAAPGNVMIPPSEM